MIQFFKKQLNKAGFDIIKLNKHKKWPADFEEEHLNIIKKVQPYTMTSGERVYGLVEAVKYITKNKIEGDVVECGVWKGGSMLAIADTLNFKNDNARQLYLYDTYEGMPAPAEVDVSHDNMMAKELLESNSDKENNLVWAYSALDEVKKTMSISAYPKQNIHFIKGKVEDTIPQQAPQNIALLRLDTDWYESTKHELVHLFPRLVKGGVLIIDDYGYWKGARKAVDEYIAENKLQLLLCRMDETGRIAIKQ